MLGSHHKRMRIIISPTPNVYVINVVRITNAGAVSFQHVWSSAVPNDVERVLKKTHEVLAKRVVGAVTIRLPDASSVHHDGDALHDAASAVFDEKHVELLGHPPTDDAVRADYCERILANVRLFAMEASNTSFTISNEHVAPLPKMTILFHDTNSTYDV